MKKFSVESVIDSIIKYFKKHLEIDENQEAILKFSIHLVISFITSMGMALLAAFILGVFPYVLVIMLTTAVFRTFSGGAHSSTMFGCAFYGTVIMNILGLIAKYTNPAKGLLAAIILFVIMFSIWSLYKYAPADTPGKPITTKVKRQKLKRFSFVTLFVWCFVCLLWYTGIVKNSTMILASAMGVLWQSFSLTKWGYAFLHHMDKVFQMMSRKKGELI